MSYLCLLDIVHFFNISCSLKNTFFTAAITIESNVTLLHTCITNVFYMIKIYSEE